MSDEFYQQWKEWNYSYKFFVWLKYSICFPLMAMNFLLLLMNTLLRDTKDTLLLTSTAGVEAIPIIKSWFVIPISMIFFLFYYKISAKMNIRETLIFFLGLFCAFYLIFALLLYPNQEEFQFTSLTDTLQRNLPESTSHIQNLIKNWLLGLFYSVTELYASFICQFLFWRIANDHVSINQAKSIYPLISAIGNVGMVVAGYLLHEFADHRDLVAIKINGSIIGKENSSFYSKGEILKVVQKDSIISMKSPLSKTEMYPMNRAWQSTLLGLSIMLIGASFLLLYTYDAIIFRSSLNHPINNDNTWILLNQNESEVEEPEENIIQIQGIEESSKKNGFKKPKKKVDITFYEAFMTLSKSKPLRAAAILVISYGINISLIEVTWKGQVQRSLDSTNDYSRFMANFWQMTGIISMLFMFVGRFVLQKVGYIQAVLFTPVCMGFSGGIFFLILIYQGYESSSASLSLLTCYFGGAAAVMAKSGKYAFFDATKEIIFIPLDDESRNLGKAAIDVIAYRLSKSGGSILMQLVIFSTGSLFSMPAVITITVAFGTVSALWIYAGIEAADFLEWKKKDVVFPTSKGIELK